MPKASRYWYIIQAWCALTSYPEWHMLWAENASAIASFIFEDICYDHFFSSCCEWLCITLPFPLMDTISVPVFTQLPPIPELAQPGLCAVYPPYIN